MFELSSEPIDPQALRDSVRNVAAGGFVAFEGWIRDHNEGRQVTRLEYEAYAPLCITEGNAILDDAKRRFGLLEARCVHRVGTLDLEGCAVWVGVSAAHRGEAFDACRYIIDVVKHRLPIWKKEYYLEGDSGWVNCERCAHSHEHGPQIHERDFYARQLSLKEIGDAGQEKLRRARVLIVGAGGLGSPAGLYLAAAGIGRIGICESDRVEASNLHRQILFGAADLGQPKVDRAVERLRALNPLIEVESHAERLGPHNVERIIGPYDVLVDGSDNFETKFLLNDAAVRAGKILVQASIYQYEGQLFVYRPGAEAPCLRCLWPEIPEPGCVGSCAEAGVLGAVPGVFGSLQAMEVLKQLLDLPGRLDGEICLLDLLSLRTRRIRAERQGGCPACGHGQTAAHGGAELPLEVSVEDYLRAPEHYTLIDIRETEDGGAPLARAALKLPASTFMAAREWIERPAPWLLCCAHGHRSRYLAMALRRAGHGEVYSLVGGSSLLLSGAPHAAQRA